MDPYLDIRIIGTRDWSILFNGGVLYAGQFSKKHLAKKWTKGHHSFLISKMMRVFISWKWLKSKLQRNWSRHVVQQLKFLLWYLTCHQYSNFSQKILIILLKLTIFAFSAKIIILRLRPYSDGLFRCKRKDFYCYIRYLK